MDNALIKCALESMMEATKDDATPIIRRLARIQARHALEFLATVAAANDEAVARKWFPHLCFAGEPMHEGQFREPWPMVEERTALAMAIFDGWYEGNEDWDSPHNDHLQMRAYFAADAAIRLLSQNHASDSIRGSASCRREGCGQAATSEQLRTDASSSSEGGA